MNIQLNLSMYTIMYYFLNLCFSTGNFQDGMLVGRSLAILILHISAELKAFKIKIWPNNG